MTKSSQNISKADIEVALDRILIDLSKRFNVSKDEITEDFLNAKILEEYNKRNEAAKESGMEIFGLTQYKFTNSGWGLSGYLEFGAGVLERIYAKFDSIRHISDVLSRQGAVLANLPYVNAAQVSSYIGTLLIKAKSSNNPNQFFENEAKKIFEQTIKSYIEGSNIILELANRELKKYDKLVKQSEKSKKTVPGSYIHPRYFFQKIDEIKFALGAILQDIPSLEKYMESDWHPALQSHADVFEQANQLLTELCNSYGDYTKARNTRVSISISKVGLGFAMFASAFGGAIFKKPTEDKIINPVVEFVTDSYSKLKDNFPHTPGD